MSILKGFSVERRPVSNAAVQSPHMDEVKAIRSVCPFCTGIINFEFAVRGDEHGLDRRQVGADDFS